jgi:hypothetical protein
MTTRITKTWFDDGKVVTKEIPESEVYTQEPVAWMFTDVEGTEFFEEREDWEGKWTPLYITPPAAQPEQQEPDGIVWLRKDGGYFNPPAAQRQPLTDDEIWKFWWSRPAVDDGDMESQFVAAVRAVLAAHGITGEKT